MYNTLREKRRKEMAKQYVRYQCGVLYDNLCGECVTVEISEEEKADMIRRARLPLSEIESKARKNKKR